MMSAVRGGVVTLNDYGDADFSPTNGFGVDVSSQRLDAIDLRALSYVIARHDAEPVGVDLGCGQGAPSVSFALAGATMVLIDAYDFHVRFRTIAELIPIPRLSFLQRDLTELSLDDLPRRIDFAYSQRTLHYLRFNEAVRALRTVVDRLQPGDPVFLSVSGLNSELGADYPARHAPIAERFSALVPSVAEKHHIDPPVCLYTADDVALLAAESGLAVGDIWTSHFGNIKAELAKRP